MLAQAEVAVAGHQHHRPNRFSAWLKRTQQVRLPCAWLPNTHSPGSMNRKATMLEADLTYRNSFTTYESARAQLKDEDSRLPFLANASAIYDDDIQFLIARGRRDEALTIADQSRARTLLQGLGLASDNTPFHRLSIAASRHRTQKQCDPPLLLAW